MQALILAGGKSRQCQLLGFGIGGKGLRGAPVDMPRKLVQHEDQRQPSQRRLRPIIQRATDGLFMQGAEPAADDWIQPFTRAEPVWWPQFAKPEIEHFGLLLIHFHRQWSLPALIRRYVAFDHKNRSQSRFGT